MICFFASCELFFSCFNDNEKNVSLGINFGNFRQNVLETVFDKCSVK